MNIMFIRGLGDCSREIIEHSKSYHITPIVVHQSDVQSQVGYTHLVDSLGDTLSRYRGDYARPDLIRQVCHNHSIDMVVYDIGDGQGEGMYQVFLDHIASVVKMCSQLSQLGIKKIMIMGKYNISSKNTYDVACMMNQLMFKSLSVYDGRDVVVLQGGEQVGWSDFVSEFYYYIGLLKQGGYPRYEHRMM